MFYYPQLLPGLNLVNIQVVIPGGWGADLNTSKGLAFLLEPMLFAPTTAIKDPDAWLWQNVLDFWSVTSYESVRLNFTMTPEQVTKFVPVLAELIKPRIVAQDFLASELNELKNFWQTERDIKEDQLLRQLFKNETVVHPNADLINNLEVEDITAVQTVWNAAAPYPIISGPVATDDIIALSQVFPAVIPFKTQSKYASPSVITHFKHPSRWGLKLELQGSHVYELLIIELWDRLFKAKFFFEYHLEDMFIWSGPLEHPHLLANKIKNYELTEADFNQAKASYTKFLTDLYVPKNSQKMEKFAELIEGLHAHKYQSATYGVEQSNLDLNTIFDQISFENFKTFYQGFTNSL